MNIDKYLKLLSLIFTNTITNEDLTGKLDIMNTDINGDNINLYDLVSLFNNGHQLFKKRYNSLEKLNLGETMIPLYFTGNELIFSVYYPNMIDDNMAILSIKKQDDNSFVSTINGVKSNIDRINLDYSVSKEIRLDQEVVQSYFDLFEKYNFILKLYNQVLSYYGIIDPSNSYTIFIYNDGKRVIDDIDNITFSIIIDNDIMPKTTITLIVNPEDFNDRSCIVTINDMEIVGLSDMCNHILKNIYISKEHLPMLKPENDSKQRKK